ncbi:MAG: ABC transporter [Epulopiscium sp. Nele67-Bin002]|nr:MAG: ABC transporter [Epulopiscium sp. Nuni2H_MBin001]OON91985.1 MAG: ABC transporter [Epulopiscium sp. Nele67-Bin002]OON92598.1 MAG: ABC transporter [Epulopiscium sp. Nele67-Bin001]
MEQIICKNLEIGYDRKVIMGPLNIIINEGDYWCITGANGAGKTTFIKTLLNLTPIIGGAINLQNELKQIDIGYLPQQKPYQKNFPASVEEIVRSGFLNKINIRFYYNHHEKELAKTTITKLGIAGLEKRAYGSLSGGQQQRVLLARALCASSKVIILDEPIAGLDPVATQEMYSVIRKLNQEENITIIMISHDILHATADAKQMLHFDGNGKYTITHK